MSARLARMLSLCALVAVAVFATAGAAQAQSTFGSFTGTVTDPSAP